MSSLAHCLWCGVYDPGDIVPEDHAPACPHASGVYPAPGGERCEGCGELVAAVTYRHDVTLCLGCTARKELAL